MFKRASFERGGLKIEQENEEDKARKRIEEFGHLFAESAELEGLIEETKKLNKNKGPEEEMGLYLVGGAIKDIVLKEPFNDVDLMVSHMEIGELKHLLEGQGKLSGDDRDNPYGKFRLEPKKVDDRVPVDDKKIDIAMTRQDNETPSSKVSIENDLARRPLTRTAVAYDFIKDEVIDPYGGLEDIISGKVEILADNFDAKKEKLEKDRIKILLTLKAVTEQGTFLEEDTQKALVEVFKEKGNSVFEGMPKEVINKEVSKALNNDSQKLIETLHDLDGLGSLFPEIDKMKKVKIGDNYKEDNALDYVLDTLGQEIDEDSSDYVKLAFLLSSSAKFREDNRVEKDGKSYFPNDIDKNREELQNFVNEHHLKNNTYSREINFLFNDEEAFWNGVENIDAVYIERNFIKNPARKKEAFSLILANSKSLAKEEQEKVKQDIVKLEERIAKLAERSGIEALVKTDDIRRKARKKGEILKSIRNMQLEGEDDLKVIMEEIKKQYGDLDKIFKEEFLEKI